MCSNYDVVIIGAGAACVFMAYEFTKLNKGLKVCMIDRGGPISKRVCPIDGKKITSCVHCKTCSIMNGFGGAGGIGKTDTASAKGGNCPFLYRQQRQDHRRRFHRAGSGGV